MVGVIVSQPEFTLLASPSIVGLVHFCLGRGETK